MNQVGTVSWKEGFDNVVAKSTMVVADVKFSCVEILARVHAIQAILRAKIWEKPLRTYPLLSFTMTPHLPYEHAL